MFDHLQIEHLGLDSCFYQSICTSSSEAPQYLKDIKYKDVKFSPFNIIERNKKKKAQCRDAKNRKNMTKTEQDLEK